MLLYPLIFTSLYIIIADIRHQLIPLWALFAFALITFCNFIHQPFSILFVPLLLLSLILVISWGIESIKDIKATGSGDILLLTLTGFWISVDQIPLFLVITGFIGLISGVIWSYLFQQQRFPFAPSILIALFFTLFVL